MKNDYLDQAFGLGTRGAGDGRGAGLGYAIALALGRAGAKVVVNDCPRRPATRPANANAAGIPARGAPFDVADGEAVAAALRELEAAGWAPDVLVSNWQPEPQARGRDDAGRMAALQNVRTSTALSSCARAALPGMVRRGFGRIVLMSSVAGQATMLSLPTPRPGRHRRLRAGAGRGIRRQRHHLQRAGAGLRAHRLHAGAAGQSAVPVLPVHGGAGRTLGRAGRYRAGGGVPGRAGRGSTARCWRSTAACWRM